MRKKKDINEIPKEKIEKIFTLKKQKYDSLTISFVLNIPESEVKKILEKDS